MDLTGKKVIPASKDAAWATAPESCTITGERQDGVCSITKGSAGVKPGDTPEGCGLVYTAKATVGGKIALPGAKLLNNVAKKMADDLVENFVTHVTKI